MQVTDYEVDVQDLSSPNSDNLIAMFSLACKEQEKYNKWFLTKKNEVLRLYVCRYQTRV
jgi:hypothetical protein